MLSPVSLTSNEDGHCDGSTQQDDREEPANAPETPGSLALLGHNQLLAPGHWTGCLVQCSGHKYLIRRILTHLV